MATDEPKLTYAQLRDEIAKLTPEQLAMDVIWIGEDRGGRVKRFEVLTEDQVNPSGDGWEPISLYEKYMKEEDPDFDLAQDGEERCAVKGQPLMAVD